VSIKSWLPKRRVGDIFCIIGLALLFIASDKIGLELSILTISIMGISGVILCVLGLFVLDT